MTKRQKVLLGNLSNFLCKVQMAVRDYSEFLPENGKLSGSDQELDMFASACTLEKQAEMYQNQLDKLLKAV